MSTGWIGVDLDGTLAYYEVGKFDIARIGPPIPDMVERVKAWRAGGATVKIFTARIAVRDPFDFDMIHEQIQRWCLQHIGEVLEVTCTKDMHCIEIYDDRAVSVEMNTGRLLTPSTRGLA
jgi:hypothetical protein